MNIQYGLTDYGRLRYMLKMADLLKQKKMFEKLAKENPENQKYKEDVERTQKKAKDILA
jgi:hypothetical protein